MVSVRCRLPKHLKKQDKDPSSFAFFVFRFFWGVWRGVGDARSAGGWFIYVKVRGPKVLKLIESAAGAGLI